MSDLSLLRGSTAVEELKGGCPSADGDASAGSCCLTGPLRVPEMSHLLRTCGNLVEAKSTLACRVCAFLCRTHGWQCQAKGVLEKN